MNNVMIIDGHKAVIQYEPETDVLPGEFIGLNGGADFYADNVADLHREGTTSLQTFLEVCRTALGIDRLDMLLHARAASF